MKKIMIVGALSLSLLAAGASMTFADTPVRGNEDGEQLQNLEVSVEERLELKLSRIDELIDLERLTPEEGEEFKEVITERMDNCDEEGSGKEVNEPLEIGFGRTNEKGNGQGNGQGNGPGNGQGNGQGNGFQRGK